MEELEALKRRDNTTGKQIFYQVVHLSKAQLKDFDKKRKCAIIDIEKLKNVKSLRCFKLNHVF